MVSLNVPNVITIALVAVAAFAAIKWLGGMAGFSTSWL